MSQLLKMTDPDPQLLRQSCESQQQFTPSDIDEILDEIQLNEQQYERTQATLNINNSALNWDEIVNRLCSGRTQFIKDLISSNEIEINSQNPSNGMTLLMYSVVIGNMDLVTYLCNMYADVHITDHDDESALSYAIKYGRYRITELLYYRQLSGKLGLDLKNIAMQIHRKNKEAEFIKTNANFSVGDFMIKAIEQRAPFGEDMLFYAWYFVLNGEPDALSAQRNDCRYSEVREKPLESRLWKAMMTTYEAILSDTSDKIGWKWLKNHFINSLIWYLPHPIHNDAVEIVSTQTDDDAQKMEILLKQTLFWELLSRVRKESKKQSDLLLKEKISDIKLNKQDEWRQLIAYNVKTEYSKTARQDLCGCLLPKYTEDDLNEKKYPPSTHFSAKKHYDKNIYLNELMFMGNVLDHQFQADIKNITKQINFQTGDSVHYTAGPVKTLARSQTKVENNYINEDYPTSAKILDINRCALHFKTIKSMIRFLDKFVAKIRSKSAYSIVDIIRCKNGWSVYNVDYPQYTDIKLNVLVQSSTDTKKKIIAEVQFLLDLMSEFKKKAHKLYSIERKDEKTYRFKEMQVEMSRFKDNTHTNDTFADLIDTDNIKQFKLLWRASNSNVNVLMDPNVDKFCHSTALFHLIMSTNSKINEYFKREYRDSYCAAIINYFRKYVEKYNYATLFYRICTVSRKPFVDHSAAQHSILINVLHEILNVMDGDIQKLEKIFFCQSSHPFLDEMCSRYPTVLEYVLSSNKIADCIKKRLIFNEVVLETAFMKGGCIYVGFINKAEANAMLPIIHYIKNDATLLHRALLWKLGCDDQTLMMRICGTRDPLSTTTLTLLLNNTVLSEHFKYNLFLIKDTKDEENAMHHAFGNIYSGNALCILSYFNQLNKKQLLKLLLVKNKNGNTAFVEIWDSCIILRVLYYFKHHRKMLMKLLSEKNGRWLSTDGRSVFGMICRGRAEVFQYIVTHCAVLTETDIFQLLSSADDDGKIPLMYSSDVCCVEMLKYVQNKKELSSKLFPWLSHRDADNKTALMFAGMTFLNFILNSEVLTNQMKLKLLSHYDEDGRSALYYATRRTRDVYRGSKYYFDFEESAKKVAPVRMIDYLITKHPNQLRAVVMKQSNDGETFLMIGATSDKTINRILSSLRRINDNKLVADLLNCKNAKNETVYDIAVNSKGELNVFLLKQWFDYLRFDAEISDSNKSLDLSFLEEKKAKPQNNQNVDVKCMCGQPLRTSSASMLRHSTGFFTKSVTCAGCQKVQSGLVQACGNARPHAKYILCQWCYTLEREKKKKELAHQELTTEMKGKEYKTNPFITACCFDKLDTIQTLLARIGDNKEILMKLLLSKNDRGAPALFYMSRKLLQLLVTRNKLLSLDDKFKIVLQKDKSDEMVLLKRDTATECAMEIVSYFAKDRKKLLSIISPCAYFYVADEVRIKIFDYLKNDKTCLKKLMLHICASKRNQVQTLKCMISNDRFGDKFVVQLFDEKYENGATAFGQCCGNDSCSEKQMVYEMVNHIKNDRLLLMRFMSRVMSRGMTPLMQLCQNNDSWSMKVIQLILRNPVLSKKDKLVLLNHKDSQRECTALQYACNNEGTAECALQILDYFKNDESALTQLVSQGLLFCSCQLKVGDNRIMRKVLSIINNLKSKTLKWKLLSELNKDRYRDGGLGGTLMFRAIVNIGIVLEEIHDDEMLEKLLNIKNEKKMLCVDVHKKEVLQGGSGSFNLKSFTVSWNNVKYIRAFVDYLKWKKELKGNVDVRFIGYDTNPFITACHFGRAQTIMQCLECIKNDKGTVRRLWLNNHDADGNNGLMVLAKNKYFDIMNHILNNILVGDLYDVKLELLFDANAFERDHLLLYLCKENQVDIVVNILKKVNDGKIILQLLNQKNNDHKSCIEYIPQNQLLSFV